MGLNIVYRGKDPCPAKCPRCDGSCDLTRGHAMLQEHVCTNNDSHQWY